MEQLGELMNMVDEIKEKITDNDYINLVDKIKTINDNRDYPDLYLVKYWEQSVKILPVDYNSPIRNKIMLEKKVIVAKFCRKHFENLEEIDKYIRHFEDKKDLFIRTTYISFPLIQTSEDYGHYIPTQLDETGRDDDDANELIEFHQFIPISIKKL